MKQSQRRQAGFSIAAVLVVIALLGIVAAAIGAASRGTTNTATTTQKSDALSSSIVYQAGQLDSAFERMIAKPVDKTQIVFDQSTATYGLMHPTDGTIRSQNPPSEAFAAGAASKDWLYKKTVKLNGIGTTANDYVIALADLSSDVCASINTKLTGSATIPVSTGALAGWTTLATAVDDSAVAGVGAEKCVATSDGKYVYYRSVVDN